MANSEFTAGGAVAAGVDAGRGGAGIVADAVDGGLAITRALEGGRSATPPVGMGGGPAFAVPTPLRAWIVLAGAGGRPSCSTRSVGATLPCWISCLSCSRLNGPWRLPRAMQNQVFIWTLPDFAT